MQSSFTLTREDFARFQKLVAKRFKRKVSLFSALFFVQVSCWLFVGMAGASLFKLMEQYPELSGSLKMVSVFLALALVAMLIAAPTQQALLRKHMLLSNGAFLSKQTIRVSENALLIEAERGRSELAWSSFLGVEQDNQNYYLLVDAMQAVIVPKASVAAFRTDFESRLSLIKNSV
mgnify:CR=1 FL=1